MTDERRRGSGSDPTGSRTSSCLLLDARNRWAVSIGAPDSRAGLGTSRSLAGRRSGVGTGAIPSIVNEVVDSPGERLDDNTRSVIARRMGHDFGEVRIHIDRRAAESARAIDAVAYTVGRHVVFGAGQFAPSSLVGQRTLAHEMTHVIQQGTERPSTLASISSPSDPTEREADLVGSGLARPRLHGGQSRFELARQTSGQQGTVAQPPAADPASGHSAAEIAEAALIATGSLLQGTVSSEAEFLRRLYNEGAARIVAEQARLLAQGLPEAQVAQRLAAMRHQLAVDVRQAGSSLLRRGAEAFDAVRGNVGRPTYESLRAIGKTDAQIIANAARTNEFVNRLPRTLRWTGRGLWVISAGISIYVVVSAPPGQGTAVAEREIGGLAGGAAGGVAGAGFCVAFGIATEGLGLVVCGLLGSVAGFEAGRQVPILQMLDITPHQVAGQAGRLYQIAGDWDEISLFIVSYVRRRVTAAENVLVVATGQVSGERMGGRGHYREFEVIPANDAAVALFGGVQARFVPQYLLQVPSNADLMRAGPP